MMDKNRIEWLDGIKGIACLLIFLHHFLLVFYPAIHYGNEAPSWFYNIDTALSQSPLSVVVNGNYLVALFCMISSIVVSLQVMAMTDKTKLADIVIKRYFRLMLPLLPVGLLVYVLLRFGFFSHLDVAAYTQSPWAAQMYNSPISLKHALKSIFVNTWFFGDSVLSTAFWMLSELFYGTFLSAILSVVSWKYRRNTWLLYVTLALFFFNRNDLTLAFILGTLLANVFFLQGHRGQNVLGGGGSACHRTAPGRISQRRISY